MFRIYHIYIITNKINKVLYIGITNNLQGRILQHKNKVFPGFTSKYNVNKLVYFEESNSPYDAIMREKQLKESS